MKWQPLRQAVTERLERPSQAEAWMVPSEIRIETGSIVYCADEGTRRVSEREGLLEDFLELRDADGSAILKYARRWGVLGLCKHNLPADHPELWPLSLA